MCICQPHGEKQPHAVVRCGHVAARVCGSWARSPELGSPPAGGTDTALSGERQPSDQRTAWHALQVAHRSDITAVSGSREDLWLQSKVPVGEEPGKWGGRQGKNQRGAGQWERQ